MKPNLNVIQMKGLRREIDLSKVQWNSDTGGIGEEAKLSSEEIEELKEQTRQGYEAKGLEWRGKMIPLRFISSLTGGLESVNLDFRDEV